jgi:hypothetical protein
VALFIIAVGLQLFPRFLSRPLTHADRATWGSGLVALALVARIIGQPLDPGSTRLTLLLFATAALPLGLLVASSAFDVLHAPASSASTVPAGNWRRFLAVAGIALAGVLVLHGRFCVVACDILVAERRRGADPSRAGRLAVSGFAVARVFGRFLILRRPELEGASHAGALVAGRAGVDRARLIFSGPALRWLGPCSSWPCSARGSGRSACTTVPRRVGTYVTIRRGAGCLAFVFLVFSEALQVGLFDARCCRVCRRRSPNCQRRSAQARFLLPLMVALAALTPIFSADVLKHRVRIEVIVDLLLAGALVRVLAETIGGTR